MKKTKMEKGITLIALIITIVVLLILAIVTIGAVQENDIIGYAQKAGDDYNKARADEYATIQGYLDSVNNGIKGTWTQTGTTIRNTATGKTITVGNYVDYVSGVQGYTDTNGWRVLGAENGQILLV